MSHGVLGLHLHWRTLIFPPTNPHTPHQNHPYHNNCCMLLLLKASRADQQAHDSFQGHPLKPISALASCHAHP
jgi:hypothetical protein